MAFELRRLLYLLFGALALVTSISSCDSDDNGGDDPQDGCGGTCSAGTYCYQGQCIDDESVLKSGFITGDETWTSDKIYVLTNKVVVPEGVTLTIQPGTIIKGLPGAGTSATALVIARGGKIQANGTASNPIIFTSTLDNIRIGQKAGTNLLPTDRAKWGGLLVLGYAPISAGDGDVETQIEGIPGNETYGLYGGDKPNDNSGTLRYISIRHGGAEIGAGNEINGLTLGGVGTGTTIENIEIFGTLDDGIEWFGGTVNVKNVIVSYQGDDGLDIDQNYSGTVDNYIVLMGQNDGDKGLEIDGPEGSTYTDGLFTLRNGWIRSDQSGTHSAVDLKSSAQGNVMNTVFEGFNAGKMILFRASYNTDDCTLKEGDASGHFISHRLLVGNNKFITNTTDIKEIANAYANSDHIDACGADLPTNYQEAIDQLIFEQGNTIESSVSPYVDLSVFNGGWCVTQIQGYL